MAVNADNVFIGLADQGTTGAVGTAAEGTALPTNPFGSTWTGWTFSGYVSEDGLSLSPSWSTTPLKEWNGATVRTLLDDFTGEISLTEIEFLSEAGAKHCFGENNVTATAANTTHGNQLTVSLGPTLPEARAWVFRMKDGDRKAVVYVPNGQVTAIDSIGFNRNNAAGLPYTITCNDDGTGHIIYIYTDDGQVTSH